MPQEIQSLIDNLKNYVEEQHAPFENHPVVQSGEHAAIVKSDPDAAKVLKSIKAEDLKLKRIIETSFNGDLERIRKLRLEISELEKKIKGFSADERQKVLDRLNERVQIVQEFNKKI